MAKKVSSTAEEVFENEKKPAARSTKSRQTRKTPVKIISLGGLGEIGKNIYVYESADDMIIVDCGIAFPDDDMLGVDLVIPDFQMGIPFLVSFYFSFFSFLSSL